MDPCAPSVSLALARRWSYISGPAPCLSPEEACYLVDCRLQAPPLRFLPVQVSSLGLDSIEYLHLAALHHIEAGPVSSAARGTPSRSRPSLRCGINKPTHPGPGRDPILTAVVSIASFVSLHAPSFENMVLACREERDCLGRQCRACNLHDALHVSASVRRSAVVLRYHSSPGAEAEEEGFAASSRRQLEQEAQEESPPGCTTVAHCQLAFLRATEDWSVRCSVQGPRWCKGRRWGLRRTKGPRMTSEDARPGTPALSWPPAPSDR